MDDIGDILTHWAEHPHRDFALATIVRTSGSTYRKAGARMLVAPDGTTTGMVSGGCLEQEVAGHGRRVLRNGRPALLNFDTRRLLGCNGSMDVLVEPVCATTACAEDHLFAAAQQCLDRRRCLVASTLFETADSVLQSHLGTHPLLAEDGRSFSMHGLPESVRRDGGSLFHDRRPLERSYATVGGTVSVLLHTMSPPVRLYACGGGPDVVPVAALGAHLGWEIWVVVHPSQEPPELPPRCRLMVATADEVGAQLQPDARTACVIMTHNYGRDLAWLAALLPLRLPYLGLLGPQNRCNALCNSLFEDVGFSDMRLLESLNSPVGLDIGADGAGEIALSIVSEIKAVLSGRSGGFLKSRHAAIHADASSENCTHRSFKLPD